MKITIDTKEDSPEEIKKAIRLLSALVQGKEKHSSIFEDESPLTTSEPAGNAFATMFGSDTPQPELQENGKEKEEIPKVIEY